MVLPIFVTVVLLVALLISYPWHVLSLVALGYLASLPFGWLSYRRHERAASSGHGRNRRNESLRLPQAKPCPRRRPRTPGRTPTTTPGEAAIEGLGTVPALRGWRL